ncbi:MAG: alpha/beta hydrolase domain-containing protein [Steroidobacteraceae bacterium]
MNGKQPKVQRAKLRAAGMAGFVLALWHAPVTPARVVSLDIQSTAPAFGGQAFGSVGAYQLLQGIARYEVDPRLPVNASLVNIGHAQRNARGMVEFDADVVILRPVDLARGNHHLFFEPVNRGGWLSLQLFNDAAGRDPLDSAQAAGNGFLMRQGYTLVYGGWQPPYPGPAVPGMGVASGSRLTPGAGKLTARLPVARNADGSAITALLVERFGGAGGARAVTGNLTYPAADITRPGALGIRRGPDDPVQKATGFKWRYVDEWTVEITPPANAGLDAGAGFDFTYEARDPVVYGLALAAMRDLAAFLRYEPRDARGQSNPLLRDGRIDVERAVAFGASQTGRTVKTLIYNFNGDEQGRQVFDGVHAHISGASLNSQNEAFGRPGLKGDDRFPFTYATQFDPVSRRTDGWLMRCAAEGNCPKVLHTDSENEVWTAGGLLYTDTRGRDAAPPANVRMYLFASTQHTPAAATEPGMCQQMLNPLDYRPSMRALLASLDEWVTTGREPPASRYPTVAGATLVTPDRASTGFPALPGVAYNAVPPRPVLADAGVDGVGLIDYPVFVPAVDQDGNTRAGIRMPELQVPLATYTGWNLRRAGFGEGSFCVASGSYIPFALTRAAREGAKDPRASVQERYGSRANYLQKIDAVIQQMQKDRLLLPEDGPRILQHATAAAVSLPP